jgi:hypothetical protein
MLFFGLAYEAREMPSSVLNDAENRVNENGGEERECILYKVNPSILIFFSRQKGFFSKRVAKKI